MKFVFGSIADKDIIDCKEGSKIVGLLVVADYFGIALNNNLKILDYLTPEVILDFAADLQVKITQLQANNIADSD